ncbi:MAG: hypothetical protein AB8G22_08785 [Saprospiraceae bacterium]
MTELILLTVSWALVGLIWTIQLVHYPSFHYIDPAEFSAFHQHHTNSITLIVLPLMFAELGLSAYLAYQYNFSWQYLLPLFIVLAIWASTFLISVPLHNQLATVKNELLIKKLVDTNWIRTVLWTGKAVLISFLYNHTSTHFF